MIKKRYSVSEIAAKLREADQLAADGVAVGKIVQALGVSAMTYHRWRKARERYHPAAAETTLHNAVFPAGSQGQVDRIKQLEVENSYLRRLLTDMLIEKAKLEQAAREGRN